MNIQANTKIAYTSGLGRVEANVESIVLAPAADGRTQVWMNLTYIHPRHKIQCKSRICADHASLKMFKVEVLG